MNLPRPPAGTPVTNDYVRGVAAMLVAEVVRIRSSTHRHFPPVGFLFARDGTASAKWLDGLPPEEWPAILAALADQIGADWVFLVCETYRLYLPDGTPRSSIPNDPSDASNGKWTLLMRLEGGGVEYTWHAEIHPDGTVDAPTERADPWVGGLLANLAPRHN